MSSQGVHEMAKKQIYHKIAEEQLYYDTSVNIPGRCMQVEEKFIKLQVRS